MILIGPPLSGKSTYARKQIGKNHNITLLSCDIIRMSLINSEKYVFSPEKEGKVWNIFYSSLKEVGDEKKDVIIDNTNCRLPYIHKIEEVLGKEYYYARVYFDVPLWKLYMRNVIRRLKEDKWIPFKVIKQMRQNFLKLKNYE